MGYSAQPLILLATMAAGLGTLTSDWDGQLRPQGPLNAPSVQAVGPDLRIGPDRRIHLEADVRGNPVTFLVDTGAATTILSRRDADRLGLSAGHTPVFVRGVGGRTEARLVQVPELRIGSQRIDRLDALVIDDLETSLLGMDALSELGQVRITFGAEGAAQRTSSSVK
jgi:clan AA aspartic protease (TIGR02281 family)